MKIRVFWNTTPCQRVNFFRHFEGALCLHFQGRAVKEAAWPRICSNHTRLCPLLLCVNQNAVTFQTPKPSWLTSLPFHKETWKSPFLMGAKWLPKIVWCDCVNLKRKSAIINGILFCWFVAWSATAARPNRCRYFLRTSSLKQGFAARCRHTVVPPKNATFSIG
jgi:hypothetical protein